MHREADRSRLFTRRALLLGAGQLGLFGLLAARLYYLQVIDADKYSLLAENNRINHRLLPPERGRIFDRHDVPLARNSPTYRVQVVREQAGDVAATLRALGRLITLEPELVAEVLAKARAKRRFVPILVREDLTWAEVAKIAVNAHELPGITLDSGLLRDYPAGAVTAHVLGYVAPVAERDLTGEALLELPEFRIGKNGIERVYDQYLRGTAGTSRFEVDAVGREIRELEREEATPGQDLGLTLDLDLQRYGDERLGREQSASAVVLDVRNGDILALVSQPSFPPEAFTNGLSHETWRALSTDPMTPLLNKAIAGQYPPGSTFKMMVALAALEAGVIDPDHEVYCPGYTMLGGHKFHCWKKYGHGKLRLVGAITHSCDVYFYDIARKVGVDAIAAMARRFGLGERLGVDLPGERGGLIPDKAWKEAALGERWQGGETLIVGIGQGFVLATPLQLAAMAAQIANGGQRIRPRLVRRAEDAATGEAGPAATLGVSEWALHFVKKGMYEVVNGERGTARASRLPDPTVAMAGKTGTSQVRRISRSQRITGVIKNEEKPWVERDHALFVAYAPFDAPRYAVAVVVEHGGGGCKIAAPIARDIMAKALELDPARRQPKLSAGGPAADGSG
jgi:penicillin-binding protein 2